MQSFKVLFFWLWASCCSAQTINTYEKLVSLSLENNIRSWANGVKEGRVAKDYLIRVKILKDNFPPDFQLPRLAYEYKITFFEEGSYSQAYLRKKGVPLLEFGSINLSEDTLSINIVNSTIHKGRSLKNPLKMQSWYSRGGGVISFFKYDCSSRQWLLVKVQPWGI